jgi:putative NADH-flavin reductase
MKIALIGYGKMGKEIEQIATTRGHEIVSIIRRILIPTHFVRQMLLSSSPLPHLLIITI